ncbi:MAG: SRPBCC family protein [Pseudonocardia sp.]|nr:SRPBCC family protein [Pseudonocardia sp.]
MSDVTTPAGTVSPTDGRHRVTFRRLVPDPVDEVWSAVTESDRLGRWFGTYTGTGRVGGTVRLVMVAEDPDGPPSTVAILECVPPERLVVEVGPAEEAEPWRITVTLSPDDGGTLLVFDQLVPEGMTPADIGPGWHFYLDRLAASLTGAPLPPWEDYEGLGGLYA